MQTRITPNTESFYAVTSSVNALEQYRRRKKIAVFGAQRSVSLRHLQETLASVFSDIEVNVSSKDPDACPRMKKLQS